MTKHYSFGKNNLGIPEVKNKAKLEDGTIVSYDRCCLAGTDPKIPSHVMSKYLGRGVIYEVAGERQWSLPGQRIDYYDFWIVYA